MYSDPLIGLRNNSEIAQNFRIADVKHDDLKIRRNFVKFSSYFWEPNFLRKLKFQPSVNKTVQFFITLSLSFATEYSNR